MGLKVKQTKNNIIVTWGNVDADVYGVFVQYCGKNMCKIPIKLVKKNKAVIRKLNNRKINNVKSFKVYVVAYHNDNGKLVEIGKTLQGHYVGRDNIKYTNVYKVKTNKDKYVLSVGKKEKIKASTILKYKGRKELSDKHTRRFRYVASNKDIVTVSKNGVMTAKSKGTCRVYVYARNMAVRVINVKVK